MSPNLPLTSGLVPWNPCGKGQGGRAWLWAFRAAKEFQVLIAEDGVVAPGRRCPRNRDWDLVWAKGLRRCSRVEDQDEIILDDRGP